MRELTTPQRRILDAFRHASGPLGVCDIKGASTSYTTAVVRRFFMARMIHVADWEFNGSNAYPRYCFGPGVDAPRPRASRADLLRRKRERQRERQRQQGAEDRAAARALQMRPAMLVHTPLFGFWGI